MAHESTFFFARFFSFFVGRRSFVFVPPFITPVMMTPCTSAEERSGGGGGGDCLEGWSGHQETAAASTKRLQESDANLPQACPLQQNRK